MKPAACGFVVFISFKRSVSVYKGKLSCDNHYIEQANTHKGNIMATKAKMDYSEFTPAQEAQFIREDAEMVRRIEDSMKARKLENAYHDLLDLLDFVASQNGLEKQALTDEWTDDQNVMEDAGDLVKGSAQYWLRMDSAARMAAGDRAENLKFDLNKAAGKAIY